MYDDSDLEARAPEIRIRAERRSGKSLKELTATGEQVNDEGGNRELRSNAIQGPLGGLGFRRISPSAGEKLAHVSQADFGGRVSTWRRREAAERKWNGRRSAALIKPCSLFLPGHGVRTARSCIQVRTLAMTESSTTPFV
jgi:hypothetical protein